MKNKVEKGLETAKGLLFRELADRFDLRTARMIVEDIDRAVTDNAVPDVLLVKACADMMVLFREEARDALDRLKVLRDKKTEDRGLIVDLETAYLRDVLDRRYRAYRIATALLHRFHPRTLAVYATDTRSGFSVMGRAA